MKVASGLTLSSRLRDDDGLAAVDFFGGVVVGHADWTGSSKSDQTLKATRHVNSTRLCSAAVYPPDHSHYGQVTLSTRHHCNWQPEPAPGAGPLTACAPNGNLFLARIVILASSRLQLFFVSLNHTRHFHTSHHITRLFVLLDTPGTQFSASDMTFD